MMELHHDIVDVDNCSHDIWYQVIYRNLNEQKMVAYWLVGIDL